MKPDPQLFFPSSQHPELPLIVDSFAGGGGASTGIALALGREPDIAINHDPEAVEMHRFNHPQTRHYCESVWQVDPIEATSGRPVGLAWFSPDCKHFSKAKGAAPRDRKIRGLAWIVLKWAALVRPQVIMLENVEEFAGWGPLKSRSRKPYKSRKGETFAKWKGQLEALGYTVEHRELRASDYGAPTIRKRLFLIARCDGRPIVWPQPTHGDPKTPEVRAGKLKPWVPVATCIDWSLPCPSIFLTKEEGRKASVKRPLVDATCRRIAKGIVRYVIQAAKPFIVNLTHGARLEDISKPLRTITGANRGEKALVVPHVTKFRSGSTGHGVDEPLHTVTAGGESKRPAGAAHALGLVSASLVEIANASSERAFPADEPLRTQCAQVKGGHFALVAAFIAKHYGGVVGIPATAPSGTVTSADSHSLVTAFLAKLRGENVGHGADEPAHTVSAQGNHFAQVNAFLVKYYGNEKDIHSVHDPLHTVTSRDRFALVTIEGQLFAIVDIGLRMLAPRELYRAQGFPESYAIGDGQRGESLRLTKKAQVKMCGNSVSPTLAQVLALANAPHLSARKTLSA